MDIAITGSTGLVGRRLVDELRTDGHRVVRVVRPGSTKVAGETIVWDIEAGTIDAAGFEGLDAVVHLAGEGIAEKRWTEEQRRRILDSRVDGTTLLCEALAGLDQPPGLLLSGSAVGLYGETGDRVTDETGPAGDDFPATVVLAWEAATAPAEAAGIRVVHLRTGVVLSADGGALAKQLLPFKLGLGGRAGPGTQYLSWVHIDDEIGAIIHLLASPEAAEVSGPANLTAPEPVTNSDFTKALGAALHRPTTILPMIGPRLLYGRDLADSLLLTSQRVVPGVLESAGYTFEHPEIRPALVDLVG